MFNFDALSNEQCARYFRFEGGFGAMTSQFGFLDMKKKHAITLAAGWTVLCVVGFLMYNCMTCLYGNEVSKFFDLEPPSLEDYLR